METPKILQALMKGVVGKAFFEDESITPAVIKEQLLAADESVTVEALSELAAVFEGLVLSAAKDDWELAELDTKLTETTLSEIQQEVVRRSWRNLKPKIHDVLTQKSQWNNSLKNLSWRVDVKTKSRASGADEELNEPTAIVELVLGKTNASTTFGEFQQSKDDSVVRLEMTREQLQEAVYQINRIQTMIEKVTGET